jgi:hypothetical protein
MVRYLFFNEGTTEADILCLPVSQVEGIEIAANNAINIYFNDLGGADTNDGLAVVNVTAGKTKEAMNDIVDAINNSTDPFIVVADDVNSEYLSSHITSMGAIQETA